jgi:nucleolar GTP-binding protein
LRTLSELTTEMTNAGLDPSRIQERAEMLAKIQGAKQKRIVDDDEDVEMDDEDDDDVSGSDNGMDVDDGERAPTKCVKTNSGGVINKRAPRSNRQTAGLRDKGVSFAQICL